MMLSRLACILIRVYAPQGAAAQPAATTGRWAGALPPLVRMSMVAGLGDDCGDDHGGILTGARAGRLGNSRKVDSGIVRVLVAEDDEGLGEVLARGLREQSKLVGAGVRIETIRGVGYRIVAS